VAEEVSAVSATAEAARLASAALYAAPLAYLGNKVQKKDFLRPVLSGEKVGALALTEPQAGSDAGSIKTRAQRDGRDFILDRKKTIHNKRGVLRTISFCSRLLIPVDLLGLARRLRDSAEFEGSRRREGVRSSRNERRHCRPSAVSPGQCPRRKSRGRSEPWFPDHLR